MSERFQPLNQQLSSILDKMVADIQSRLQAQGIDDAVMIGIRTGGVWVAEALHQRMSLPEPLGHLNISFYRDDFSKIGLHPQVEPSALPFAVDDRHIVLVDDVLHTGRTIRAALNELFDYGRPASVLLAVLVDRPGRELPVQADVIGQFLELDSSEYVQVSGPPDTPICVSLKTT